MVQWFRELCCGMFRGHQFDARPQRRTAIFSRHPIESDPQKTRCVRCEATFYVLYECSCGAYGCGSMAV